MLRKLVAQFLLLFVLLSVFTTTAAADESPAVGPILDSQGVWQDEGEMQFVPFGYQRIVPERYRLVSVDPEKLIAILDQAPLRFTPEAEKTPLIFKLPLPDGSYGRFSVVSAPMMTAELAAKLPGVATFAGQGIDDPTATIRLDITPNGFHGMILSESGTIFIDPYTSSDNVRHMVYYKHHVKEKEPFNYMPPLVGTAVSAYAPPTISIPAGPNLRTYRAAIGATGEYTIFHGGTVPLAQAAIVTTMNRVSGIYEREVAITFVLVDNSGVVYADPGADPYNNDNAGTLINQSQTQMDGTIGSANYDIGHVFSTGAGGLAGLGVVCTNGSKARGVTGTGSPVGDPYDVDYVAHEIGHQFGGNHTFNGDSGSCAGGNRNGPTAYEPGSGSTIQAYAGICAPQNTQNNSDDYFHTISFDEIINYSTSGGGAACPVVTATGNSSPIPSAGTGGYVIPIDTPFELTGSATDPDGDPLVYRWEQFDLGATGHPNLPVGDAPIFRSFAAISSPTRVFPQHADLLNNTQTIGEILPSYSRNLTFRFTALDYQSGGGGVDYDTVSFTADAAAGPFLVTDPNTAENWTTGTLENISWNVAGTNAAPVNCANVDIYISYDGGYTYGAPVVTGVPNDGMDTITVPITQTLDGRLKVKCSDNIFFDISDEPLVILSSGPHIQALPGAGINSMSQAPASTVDKILTINDLGNAQLDWSVLEDASVDCASPEEISWLSFLPSIGSTAAGSSSPVTIRFNSAGLLPGTYNANLCINSNDADAADQLKIIPVTMEVVDIVCKNYVSADVPVVIPTAGTPLITSDINIPDNGTVYDVNVAFAGDHTWFNDLFFTLQSPSTTQRRVLDQSCAGEDNFNIALDDESTRLTGSWPCPPVDGLAYQPSNSLDIFDGENINGLWQLQIQDTFDADGGNLTGWSLDICVYAPPPTPGQHIEMSQPDVTSYQYPDTVFHQTLGIYNPGDALLNWSVGEDFDADCLTPEDVPWLSTIDLAGTTNGNYDADQLTLTFDSAGLLPGNYTANICITNDDVDAADQLQIIPVTMVVQAALCTQYSATDVGLRIPPTGKAGTTVSTLTVNGGPANLSDVNLLGLGGTHDRINNINFSLDAPSATTTVLVNDATTDACGNNEIDFSLNLDDAGTAGPISCGPLGGGGTWQPDGSLAAFNGEDSNGNWLLTIVDDTADGGPADRGVGQLDSWSLELCELCVSPGDVAGLTIGATALDADLSWTDLANESYGYQLWRRANDPYFDPGTMSCFNALSGPDYFCTMTATNTTLFTHVNALGDPANNYFYVVYGRNLCGSGSANIIGRVGEFDFTIIPGS